MKKTHILSIILTASIAFGCDMDKQPHGTLIDDEAIQSVEDCRSYRNGLYATMRFLTSGMFINYSDLQTDLYHGIIGTNPYGTGFNLGTLLPAMSEVEEIWGGYYGTIGSVNFLVSKTLPLLESEIFTEEQKAEMRYYVGEALFMRAFSYYYLTERFCKAYNSDIANEPAGGMPIVTTYDPTDDNSQYPGRNTLAETYAQIFKDLEVSLEYIKAYENIKESAQPAAMSPYITSDVVNAMTARVALTTKDYQRALTLSEEVINSRRYSIEPSVTLGQFWQYDYGQEALMLVTMTQQYLGYSTGNYFLTNTGNPPFIPTQGTIDLYDKDKDNRFSVYFTQRTILQTENTPIVYAFSKYPGNRMLFVAVNNFTHMGKPFRISEQYLIAAEAAAELGQETKANRYLNDLKSRRINGHSSDQQTGELLRSHIRQERQRELIGEGFRLGDLKRWGLGFQRSEGQNNSVINTNGNVHRTEYLPDDYRFVWPIPKAEIDANPQIKGQQNPGY